MAHFLAVSRWCYTRCRAGFAAGNAFAQRAYAVALGFMGFVFAPHLALIAAMVVAVSLGSYAGTFLRGRLPEALFRKILKVLITLLALRMIAKALFGEYV